MTQKNLPNIEKKLAHFGSNGPFSIWSSNSIELGIAPKKLFSAKYGWFSWTFGKFFCAIYRDFLPDNSKTNFTSRFLRRVNFAILGKIFQMMTYLCCFLVPSLKLWAAVILEKANSSHLYQWRELKLNKLQILFLICGTNRFVPIITRIVHEKCSQFWEFSEGCLGRGGSDQNSGPMRLKIRKKENV